MTDTRDFSLSCPIPKTDYPTVLLAHGGGGTLMQRLLETVFFPTFQNEILDQHHDAAVFPVPHGRIAFTTDSYVVNPLFFPGGDIGSLAVHGTVNDLAMSGARPLALSAGFILEEGLPMETLERVVRSMQAAAAQVDVPIVTGDTKVVDRGKGDGIFINTAGIGIIEHGLEISPRSVREGGAVLINGDLGRHGIAILAVREGLAFETAIESDSAPLADLVQQLLQAGLRIQCLRDLTRGGLASALNEIAEVSGLTIALDERAIPVREDVRGACELLGFDPLYVANEGRMAAIIDPEDVDNALEIMAAHPQGQGAAVIGRVTSRAAAPVVMTSRIGSSRIVDRLSGEQLPRIC
ncbi:MAG: hydrogenase expression/formation protein HypE [Candidatus Omnitrophica bacterium]|nr:hydrogenase expression/formation protein HypE [Candidatus Omnitrophota bacterium]